MNFKKLNNNKNPTIHSKNPEEEKIGRWLNQQRQSLNGKENGYKMDQERVNLLKDKIPDWFDYDIKDQQHNKWLKDLNDIAKFKIQNNKYPSKESKDTEEKKLGVWLSNQRTLLNRDKMTDDRRKLLEEHLPNWFNRPSRLSSTRDSPDSSNLSSDTDDI